MVQLIKACENDFDRLEKFYNFVIDNTETMAKCCRWIYGLHPRADMIMDYIKEGAMYYTEEDGKMLSAVAVTPYQSEDYRTVKWAEGLKELANDEVVTVHILAVNPDYQKQGIAASTMEAVKLLAGEMEKKAVRLDALDTNYPAQRLYESLGYERRDVKNWYAANLGLADFIVYELVLTHIKEM